MASTLFSGFNLMNVCFRVTAFFFNAPATTEIYTLSLHDALPISANPPFKMGGTGSKREDHVLTLRADRKSTRLNSSHITISYAVFCLKKKKTGICTSNGSHGIIYLGLPIAQAQTWDR